MGTVEALNWGLVALIGIFTWWHICVEATMTLGNMLVAVYAGSMVYEDVDRSKSAVRCVSPYDDAVGDSGGCTAMALPAIETRGRARHGIGNKAFTLLPG